MFASLVFFTLYGIPKVVARYGSVQVLRLALLGSSAMVMLWPLLTFAAAVGPGLLWPAVMLVC